MVLETLSVSFIILKNKEDRLVFTVVVSRALKGFGIMIKPGKGLKNNVGKRELIILAICY